VMYRGNYHILLSYFAYILKSNRFDGNNRLVFGSIFYSGDINSLLAKTHSGKSKSDEEIQDDVPNELRRPKRARRTPMMLPTSRPLLTCVGNFQEYLLSLKIRTP